MDYNPQKREIYKKEWVVDVSDSKLSVRNYLEQRDLRILLQGIATKTNIGSAAEFGCGFGRMTQVLSEFCNEVIGIEREIDLIEEARQLIPAVTFFQENDMSATKLEGNR